MTNLTAPADSFPLPRADLRLVRAAAVQAFTSLACAWASVAADLPAECAVCAPTHSVLGEFLLPQGFGTAMSPPLSMILISLTAAALLSVRVRPAALWRTLLGLMGLLYTAGYLGEPYTWVALLDPRGNHLHQLLLLSALVSAGVQGALGMQALIAGRR